MNTIVNNRGDDKTMNRLLSFLKEDIQVENVTKIRKNVYFLTISTGEYILKGFKSKRQLKLQDDFTQSLKEAGFSHSYSFIPLFKEPLFVNQLYFGCLEYIKPSAVPFHYKDEKDRKNGLETIIKFHYATKQLVEKFEERLPSFNLLIKWKERYSQFLLNIQHLKYFIQEDFLYELVRWGDWAINELSKEEIIFPNEQKVILHGDVAHHNFIRDINKELYLIDFDLISVGFPFTDLLQYANRILPFIKWSAFELMAFDQLKKYMKEKAFLYALIFPTDIYREWNRMLKEKTYYDPAKIRHLLQLTIGQFYLRQRFINEIKNMLK
ncbi:phosphotransferase [Bacillus aquiflavi]|uniref:Phosphotransferase n=1 Tax=Bacillus aquiflavi TaxID=2672567 RepID=A0A7W1X3W0_9BACI|nr:phosphotransferase [Bacillus aquiflavi]MBA4537179.1 phosphotransferase [Bacillus aquiflavi]